MNHYATLPLTLVCKNKGVTLRVEGIWRTKQSETILWQMVQSKHSLKYTAEFIYIKKKKNNPRGKARKTNVWDGLLSNQHFTGGPRSGATILQSNWAKLSKYQKWNLSNFQNKTRDIFIKQEKKEQNFKEKTDEPNYISKVLKFMRQQTLWKGKNHK